VNVAHSADLHGAMTGIMSPVQLQAAASAARKHSEAMAGTEIGDWTDRATAASAQLLSVTRITSQARADQVVVVVVGVAVVVVASIAIGNLTRITKSSLWSATRTLVL